MAEISINGKMLVKTLKNNFKEAYGVGIRVYHGKKFANDDETLSGIRAVGSKGGTFKIHGRMLIKNVEDKFKEAYGIRVQIENKDGDLADNNISLSNTAR